MLGFDEESEGEDSFTGEEEADDLYDNTAANASNVFGSLLPKDTQPVGFGGFGVETQQPNVLLTSMPAQQTQPIAAPSVFGAQPSESIPAQTNVLGGPAPADVVPVATGPDLPYVTISIKGLKPSEESRVIAARLNLDDGSFIQFEMFVTAGNIPSHVTHTKFGGDEKDSADNKQKSSIHARNAILLSQSNTMPLKLSDGMTDTGVCAQKLLGFKAEQVIKKDLQCNPDSNRPRSIRRGEQQTLFAPQQTEGFGGQVGFGGGGGIFGNFAGGQQPSAGGQGGFGGGLVAPTVFAPMQQVAEDPRPPGTQEIKVPKFEKLSEITVGYKVPGGPYPISVGKGPSGKGTYYWYQLPGGQVVKSEKKYLGLGDSSHWSAKHGSKQDQTVNQIKAMFVNAYGPNYAESREQPVSLYGAVSGKKSGKKSGAKTLIIPQGLGQGGFGLFGGQNIPATGTQPNPIPQTQGQAFFNPLLSMANQNPLTQGAQQQQQGQNLLNIIGGQTKNPLL